jgi:hypothetical protein
MARNEKPLNEDPAMFPVVPMEMNHLAAQTILYMVAAIGAMVSFVLNLR